MSARRPHWGLVFLVALVLPISASGQGTSDGQVKSELNAQVPVRMGYLLSLPKGYEQQPTPWPLLLFLHGAGERGDDLELVKKHGPPKLIAAGKEFPFVVVSPQCPTGKWWEPIELVALIDDICAKYRIDPDRIYVTGLSMGGFGSWRLAAYAPDRLAAIAPICGGGEAYWARQFAHLPVWAFHGAKDPGVPLERSQAMIDALKKAGAEPKFTIYPDAAHDCWTVTYDDPALYEWLLAQKRTKPAN
ncbi:MAG: prolyl oligopeptidase family serine peptidase [Pirellulaceae bacterium]